MLWCVTRADIFAPAITLGVRVGMPVAKAEALVAGLTIRDALPQAGNRGRLQMGASHNMMALIPAAIAMRQSIPAMVNCMIRAPLSSTARA